MVLKEFKVQVYDPVVQVNEQQFSTAASSVPGAGILGLLFGRLLVGVRARPL